MQRQVDLASGAGDDVTTKLLDQETFYRDTDSPAKALVVLSAHRRVEARTSLLGYESEPDVQVNAHEHGPFKRYSPVYLRRHTHTGPGRHVR
jgi:hypothetical protein